jgi:hypothetical protein
VSLPHVPAPRRCVRGPRGRIDGQLLLDSRHTELLRQFESRAARLRAACGTPLSFQYDTANARIYTTIGSLDHPEDVNLVKQFGIESRLPWVKFCEEVPGERTGESAQAQEFLQACARTKLQHDARAG